MGDCQNETGNTKMHNKTCGITQGWEEGMHMRTGEAGETKGGDTKRDTQKQLRETRDGGGDMTSCYKVFAEEHKKGNIGTEKGDTNGT